MADPLSVSCPDCRASTGAKCRSYKGQGKQTCKGRSGAAPTIAQKLKLAAVSPGGPAVPTFAVPIGVLAEAARHLGLSAGYPSGVPGERRLALDDAARSTPCPSCGFPLDPFPFADGDGNFVLLGGCPECGGGCRL